MRDMFRAMTQKAPLPDRLRKYVLRLPDSHPTKRLCLEAAAALDPPPVIPAEFPPRLTGETWRSCHMCDAETFTALDVCPECGAEYGWRA